MSSADDKLPQWFRVLAGDMDTPEGRHIIGGGSTGEWADYGRWFALRQHLVTTPGASVDVSSQRDLMALARSLGFNGPKCREWLDMLAECGAIDPESWADGIVCDRDLFNQQVAYVEQCKTNKRNRSKRRNANESNNDTSTEREPTVNESCNEPSTKA